MVTRSAAWGAVLILGMTLSMAGCSRAPERLYPPEISPSSAGSAAMTQYDTNGDGVVQGEELAKAPSLQAALEQLDKNADGGVSAEEIADRIQAWQDSKVAIMSASCRVLMDGAPLEGATVTFEPEAFLGENVKPASGVTGPDGRAIISLAEADRPEPNITGVHCGLYKVKITKGGEIPAKYNTDTTLGAEVAMGSRALEEGLTFELKSK